MPRASEERNMSRREEIVNACGKLYQTRGFREITVREIGEVTSFSRPTIYNYFETKEEIFLALLRKEYDEWTKDLRNIIESDRMLTTDELAAALAHTLEPRTVMLKIQAMNLYEVEDNSRLQCLTEFKKSFAGAMNEIDNCLEKFLPEMTGQERIDFRYSFFPFMYGIYPYAFPTEKQCEAMDAVGLQHPQTTVYQLAYQCLIKILKR